MKKICLVVAIADTAQSFLRGHIEALSKDYDVYLVGNIKKDEDISMLNISEMHRIDIVRNISVWHDLRATWQAFRYFRKMKFDAVHSMTPKAGLVTALASWFAGIKQRIHMFTGQVWATRTGLSRWLLKSIDKIIVLLDNHILIDGKSQRAFLEREGVLRKGQAIVFGPGSSCGVNLVRFAPNVVARKAIRSEINIKDDMLCYIYIGRLNHDKGIGEIYEAFNRLSSEVKNVFLLFVGKDEEGYLEKLSQYTNIDKNHNFCFYGYTTEPEKLLNAGDVYLLPSHREGMPTSVLEAACVGLPSICSDAYGVLDSFIENETALCCHVGDSDSLYQCMRKLYDYPDLRKQLGEKGRQRVLNEFSGKLISKYWVDFYNQLLG